jgi:Type IV secretion system pilin
MHHNFDPTKYTLLAPLPCSGDQTGCVNGELQSIDLTGKNIFGRYLNLMIKIFIGLCAVLAVVMIVMGGMEYMTSELVSSKEAGKDRITNALFGLLIALGSFALLNTINPDLLKTDVKIETTKISAARQVQFYSGGGSCTPITSPTTNPCTPANLTSFGTQATNASAICNGESNGIPNAASGVDVCKNGEPFSFGLFQINIIAHANSIPGGVCSGIFQTSGTGTQGTCLERNNGVCVKYDCRVTNSSKYESCKAYITNPTNNIAYAVNLLNRANWNQWGANRSCKF